METILLVEDNLDVASTVGRELAMGEFEVTVVTSSAAARAQRMSFDIGVFDLTLRDECGTELAEELLRTGRIGRAVFFTGASWQPLLRRAARMGPLIEKQQGTDALLSELRCPRFSTRRCSPASLYRPEHGSEHRI